MSPIPHLPRRSQLILPLLLAASAPAAAASPGSVQPAPTAPISPSAGSESDVELDDEPAPAAEKRPALEPAEAEPAKKPKPAGGGDDFFSIFNVKKSATKTDAPPKPVPAQKAGVESVPQAAKHQQDAPHDSPKPTKKAKGPPADESVRPALQWPRALRSPSH